MDSGAHAFPITLWIMQMPGIYMDFPWQEWKQLIVPATTWNGPIVLVICNWERSIYINTVWYISLLTTLTLDTLIWISSSSQVWDGLWSKKLWHCTTSLVNSARSSGQEWKLPSLNLGISTCLKSIFGSSSPNSIYQLILRVVIDLFPLILLVL